MFDPPALKFGQQLVSRCRGRLRLSRPITAGRPHCHAETGIKTLDRAARHKRRLGERTASHSGPHEPPPVIDRGERTEAAHQTPHTRVGLRPFLRNIQEEGRDDRYVEEVDFA